jgi:hypothetical protein
VLHSRPSIPHVHWSGWWRSTPGLTFSSKRRANGRLGQPRRAWQATEMLGRAFLKFWRRPADGNRKRTWSSTPTGARVGESRARAAPFKSSDAATAARRDYPL